MAVDASLTISLYICSHVGFLKLSESKVSYNLTTLPDESHVTPERREQELKVFQVERSDGEPHAT